jgi:hypothetical protein
MAKKKSKRPTWARTLFLQACKELKPFADHWHSVGDMEIDGFYVADTMQDIIHRHGRPGVVAATAVASAWNWLLQDEDIRGDAKDCSENSVASEYFMAFWWLGLFHANAKPVSVSKSKKKAAKRRR